VKRCEIIKLNIKIIKREEGMKRYEIIKLNIKIIKGMIKRCEIINFFFIQLRIKIIKGIVKRCEIIKIKIKRYKIIETKTKLIKNYLFGSKPGSV